MNDSANDVIVACDDLGRDIFGKRVLDQVTFSLAAGSILAILGPNGAGKTTLIRVCMGVLSPTRGEVRVWNRDPVADGPDVRIRCGVATEDSAFYPSTSVLENLVLWGRLFGMSRSEAKAAALRELANFGAEGYTGEAAGSLSAGQRKRVALARALMTEPELLVLDEPTAGLDLEARRTLRRRLTEPANGRRMTAIIASHEAGEVEKVATHLLLLDRGRVRDFGPIGDVVQGSSLEAVLEERFFGDRSLTE